MLISVGEEETASPKVSAMTLKMWDLDKIQVEGSSTNVPTCIRSIRIFTNKYPESQVCFLVL